jgi:hypothetical protein
MNTEFAVVTHYAEDGQPDSQEQLTATETKARFPDLWEFILSDDEFSELTIVTHTRHFTITAIP